MVKYSIRAKTLITIGDEKCLISSWNVFQRTSQLRRWNGLLKSSYKMIVHGANWNKNTTVTLFIENTYSVGYNPSWRYMVVHFYPFTLHSALYKILCKIRFKNKHLFWNTHKLLITDAIIILLKLVAVNVDAAARYRLHSIW